MATRAVYSLSQPGWTRKLLCSTGQQSVSQLAAAWRPVVTAFVQRPDDKVLIVRRSDKVEEEVGFKSKSVHVVRAGRPLPVKDGHHRFLVQPFLLHLEDSAATVLLNWENTDFKWVTASELATLPAVPKLPETLSRLVLPPAMEEAVQQLINDRTHGAAELAEQALSAMASSAAAVSGDDAHSGEAQLELYRDLAFHLATARPCMAAVANAVVAALQQMGEELLARAEPFEPPAGEVRLAMFNAVARVRSQLLEARAEVRARGVQLLRPFRRVLTLSYSSSVLGVLKQVAQSRGQGDLSVIVCESRPLNEGAALAASLAEAGVAVTVITDAQAALFVKHVDCVVVGADAVLEGGVVNKVGTHLVALAAHEAEVPVYALADSWKLSPGPVLAAAPLPLFPPKPLEFEEEKDASEVLSGWAPHLAAAASKLQLRNIYFEQTPLQLFTGVLTEGGVLDTEALHSKIAGQLALYRQAFFSHG